MGRATSRRRVLRLDGGTGRDHIDTVVGEEPLEIRVGGQRVAVTMRTPGADVDLAAGFLVTEGVIARTEQLRTARFCAGRVGRYGDNGSGDGAGEAEAANTYNVVDLELTRDAVVPPGAQRRLYPTSSCGVCGKESLAAVRSTAAWQVRDDPLRLRPDVLAALPGRLRQAQQSFASTGGLHAAGLFDADGQLLCLREDVGRHNAVDKLVGWALRERRLPLRGTVLLVSGPASFELAQKAVMAGIPALAAVSAPSSLAVDLAADVGLTLVGFLRGTSMNVYAGVERVAGAVAAGEPRGARPEA